MKLPKKKDKFSKLSDDFKDTVAAYSSTEIRDQIAQVAINQVDLLNAKEDDQDLQEKQEAAKEAGAVYREGTAENKLKIEFCKRILEDRGVSTADIASMVRNVVVASSAALAIKS